MKFTTTRETLLRPLKASLPTASNKQLLPILSHVLVGYQAPPVLSISATDTESEYHAGAATDDSGEAGAICAPARKLFDLVRLLPEAAEITVSLAGEKLKLVSGKSRFQLSTLPADCFPAFDPDDIEHTTTVAAARLCRALEAVAPASGINDVRTYLNGTLLRCDGDELTLIASDGHRVARYVIAGLPPCQPRINAIIPRRAALEIQKALRDASGNVGLQIGCRTLRICLDTDVYSTRLIEGAYAQFERILPAAYETEITCGRLALSAALQRVGTLSGDARGARLVVRADALALSTANAEAEQGDDEVAALVTGAEKAYGLNLDYLLQALGPLDGDAVTLQFSGSGHCMITDPTDAAYLALIAPMRL